MGKDFVVHPNRSAVGPDRPGRNGHYRVVNAAPRRVDEPRCVARVALPGSLQGYGDGDGSVTFEGSTWRFVVAAARSFVVDFGEGAVLGPFGFRDRGRWWWWDGTSSDHSILETSDAQGQVRRYLEELFVGAGGIELSDLR